MAATGSRSGDEMAHRRDLTPKAGPPPVAAGGGQVIEPNAPGPQYFEVATVRADGDGVVLRLIGELDIDTVRWLDQALRPFEATDGEIVLDLSDLEFIDSNGLHRLVVSLKRQREHGGDLVVTKPKKHVLRVLEMVGLTRVLSIR
jgi:anti-sigma B factor antagonist